MYISQGLLAMAEEDENESVLPSPDPSGLGSNGHNPNRVSMPNPKAGSADPTRTNPRASDANPKTLNRAVTESHLKTNPESHMNRINAAVRPSVAVRAMPRVVIPDTVALEAQQQRQDTWQLIKQQQQEAEEQKRKVTSLVSWGLTASSSIFMNVVDLKSKVQDYRDVSQFVPLLKILQSMKSEFSTFSTYIAITPQNKGYDGPDKCIAAKYLILSTCDEILHGLIDIEIWMNGEPLLEQLLEIVPVLKYLKGVAEQFQAIEDDF